MPVIWQENNSNSPMNRLPPWNENKICLFYRVGSRAGINYSPKLYWGGILATKRATFLSCIFSVFLLIFKFLLEKEKKYVASLWVYVVPFKVGMPPNWSFPGSNYSSTESLRYFQTEINKGKLLGGLKYCW